MSARKSCRVALPKKAEMVKSPTAPIKSPIKTASPTNTVPKTTSPANMVPKAPLKVPIKLISPTNLLLKQTSTKTPIKSSSPKSLIMKNSSPKGSLPVPAAAVVVLKTISPPYELVKPRLNYGSQQSWPSDEENSTPVGKRWWKAKKKENRRSTLFKVLAFFTGLVLVICSLLAVGLYFMVVKTRGDDKHQKDHQLKTKTSICQSMSNVKAECVFENVGLREQCIGGICDEYTWTFKYDSDENTVKIDATGEAKSVRREETDFADCNELKWCREGVCVESNLEKKNWWQPNEQALFGPASGRWIERKSNNLPCFRVDPAAKTIFDDFNKSLVDKCNTAMCKEKIIKHSLKVQIMHCDSSQDSSTGIRHQPCKESSNKEIFKISKCGTCAEYDEKAKRPAIEKLCRSGIDPDATIDFDACYVECQGKKREWYPNGYECTIGGKGQDSHGGVCLMGECYEIHG